MEKGERSNLAIFSQDNVYIFTKHFVRKRSKLTSLFSSLLVILCLAVYQSIQLSPLPSLLWSVVDLSSVGFICPYNDYICLSFVPCVRLYLFVLRLISSFVTVVNLHGVKRVAEQKMWKECGFILFLHIRSITINSYYVNLLIYKNLTSRTLFTNSDFPLTSRKLVHTEPPYSTQ